MERDWGFINDGLEPPSPDKFGGHINTVQQEARLGNSESRSSTGGINELSQYDKPTSTNNSTAFRPTDGEGTWQV